MTGTLSQVPKQRIFWRKSHLYFYSQWVTAFNLQHQGESRGKVSHLMVTWCLVLCKTLLQRIVNSSKCATIPEDIHIQSSLFDKFKRLWKCKRGERTFAECSLKARMKILHTLGKSEEGSWKISTLSCICSTCAKLINVILVPCHINFTETT